MHVFNCAFLVSADEPDDVVGQAADDVIEAIDASRHETRDVTAVAERVLETYLDRGWRSMDATLESHGATGYHVMTGDDVARRLGARREGERYLVDGPAEHVRRVSGVDMSRMSVDDLVGLFVAPYEDDYEAVEAIEAFVTPDGEVLEDRRPWWQSWPRVLSERLSDYLSPRERLMLDYGADDEAERDHDDMIVKMRHVMDAHRDADVVLVAASDDV